MSDPLKVLTDYAFAVEHDAVLQTELADMHDMHNKILDEIEADEELLNELTMDNDPAKRKRAEEILALKLDTISKMIEEVNKR